MLTTAGVCRDRFSNIRNQSLFNLNDSLSVAIRLASGGPNLMSEHTWKTNANLPSVNGPVQPHFLAQFSRTVSGEYIIDIKLQTPPDSSGNYLEGFRYVGPSFVGFDSVDGQIVGKTSAPTVTIIPAELDPTNTLFLSTFPTDTKPGAITCWKCFQNQAYLVLRSWHKHLSGAACTGHVRQQPWRLALQHRRTISLRRRK